MNDFYTVIVTGTINTHFTSVLTNDRFRQTLETFESIKKHIPNSKIIYVDNSSIGLSKEMTETISQTVDAIVPFRLDLFSKFISNQRDLGQLKGLGELLSMDQTIDFIKEHPDFIGKRIFRIVGRYKLSDTFDITQYNDPVFNDRYSFLIQKYVAGDIRFELRQWSMDPNLIDDYRQSLYRMFEIMLKENIIIEEAAFKCIDHDKVYGLDKAHIEGFAADGNYRKE